MNYKKWEEALFGVFLLLMISLIYFLVKHGPEKIITFIGVENTYFILFLFAIFGGVSAFTSTSFYATMTAFYFGGLSFLMIIFVGAIGLTIGDSLFYYLGKKGHEFAKKTSHKKRMNLLKKKIEKMSSKKIFLFVFLYSGLTPLPKDILCFVLGLSKYPYLKSMVPMFFGNLLFNFLFLYLFSIGFNFKFI